MEFPDANVFCFGYVYFQTPIVISFNKFPSHIFQVIEVLCSDYLIVSETQVVDDSVVYRYTHISAFTLHMLYSFSKKIPKRVKEKYLRFNPSFVQKSLESFFSIFILLFQVLYISSTVSIIILYIYIYLLSPRPSKVCRWKAIVHLLQIYK